MLTTSDGPTEPDRFRAIYPQARRFAAFVASSGTEPDDLVQEALVRALSRGGLWELDDPLAYLRTTMLNLVRNEHRRRTRESTAVTRLQRPGGQPVDDEDALVMTESVLGALQTLPAPARAALYLVDVEGMSIGEAASMIGLSVVATRARLSRARRTLREHADVRREETT